MLYIYDTTKCKHVLTVGHTVFFYILTNICVRKELQYLQMFENISDTKIQVLPSMYLLTFSLTILFILKQIEIKIQ